MLVFLGKRGRKTVRTVKNYGGSKILRIRVPYYFSTEGSFGWGCRRFQKERPKVHKTALLAHFLHKKRGFAHFLALFLESAETPLTKNYSKIIIFEKLRISRVIPRESPSFPKILTVQSRLKITKNNSQGIIFVIISC